MRGVKISSQTKLQWRRHQTASAENRSWKQNHHQLPESHDRMTSPLMTDNHRDHLEEQGLERSEVEWPDNCDGLRQQGMMD